MTAREELRAGGFAAAVLARAEAWLLEPPGVGSLETRADPPRPVVVVRGLADGCGASTVARGLAAVLAADEPRGAAVVAGAAPGPGVKLATSAAVRLAREVAGRGCDGGRAVGRLCVVPPGEPIAVLASPRLCPVIIEVPASSPPADGLGLADHVVLVGSVDTEPALGAAVERSLVRVGHTVDVVVNRVDDSARHDVPAGAIVIVESRFAAQIARAGRGAYGPLAAPLAELAARCHAAAAAAA